ncbi:PD-(D/E)XK nuclease family protein [Ruminococcaceae bacterium OttesenSCG-928-A16]|nr:PD-(D/E)XK nuclease family protein [Ruminococcaceae bacterium OttesenSCG-928-A16]
MQMLCLILGVSGTGKTTQLLAAIKQRATQNKPSIFLVPEQFSSSAEIMMYKELGDAHSGMVEVVSFRTMAERILRLSGGLTTPVLTEAARTVFVRRALDALGSEANSFARHRRNHAFCNMCAATIEELKTAGATPAVLRSIGLQNTEPKLAELALIFEAYEAAIAGLAMDPEDRLTAAAHKADCGYFTGKACFIDNFDGFTTPEYTLLAALLQGCEEVNVALCCDDLTETDGGLGLFSPVRRTAQRLVGLAQKQNQRVLAPQVLHQQRRCAAAGLASVNALLAFNQLPPQPSTQGLTVTQYNTDWEEARNVAAAMHNLALQGMPYSRMAVVCRDLSLYEASVRRAFGLFGIPYFTDAPATIEYTAPVVFIRAALRLLREGLTTDAILALLKTGLCGFSPARLAALENYAYTWRPKAADWRAPFTGNPSGILQRFGKQQKEQLALAEETRLAVVPVLEHFIQSCRGKTAAVVSKQLYLLLQKFNAEEHAEAIENELARQGTQTAADERRRAWDVAMELLEQMELLVGKEALPATEYDDLFLLLVRSTDFGQLPQALECAVFTSADRMRLASPEVCFVLGVTEGEFPMQVGYSGLLTHADRDLLVSGGVEMPGSFENRTLLEEMFFYRALTTARTGLHISWPTRHSGAPKAISAALKPICAALAPPPLVLPTRAQAATPAAAFDLLGNIYRENTPKTAALQQALGQSPLPQAGSWLGLLSQVQNNGEFKVKDTALVRQIVGDTLTLSATKTERYYQCRFSYYMERILGVTPRRRAELSPMESGTFVHYVLEQVLNQAGETFAKLEDAALTEMAGRHADEFIAENLGSATLREKNILNRIKQTTTELLLFLRDSAAESDFVLDAVELPITDAPDAIPPLEVLTPEGYKLRVTGEVDRVDVLRQGDTTYLCIIDYKTGSKKFNLADIYCGINMQMMIYMATLRKNGGQRYPGALPAAVLYVGADPAPATGLRSEVAPVYQVDGLLLDNPDILRALSHNTGGLFLPVKFDKSGKPRASKKLAALAKIGQIERHVETLLAGMASGVYGGYFPARPLVETNSRPCDYCPYRAACRHEDGQNETKIEAPKDVFEPAAEALDE